MSGGMAKEREAFSCSLAGSVCIGNSEFINAGKWRCDLSTIDSEGVQPQC